MARFNLVTALLALACYSYAQYQGWEPFGDSGAAQVARSSTRGSYHK